MTPAGAGSDSGAGSGDAAVNRAYWDGYSDEYQEAHGEQLRTPRAWGTCAIPESRVRALGSVRGLDVLEYGCGAAQWSIFLAERGARVTALDNSGRQLAHARRLLAELGAGAGAAGRSAVRLVHAAAEAVPLRDQSFDLVMCDHGAMSYADPRVTLPEVARLLRPDGRLVCNMITPFTSVCWDDENEKPSTTLRQPYFELGRWTDVGGFVSYELGYGDWIRLFRAHGFAIDDLIELRPGRRARTTYLDREELAWAQRWPNEHIWCVTRVG